MAKRKRLTPPRAEFLDTSGLPRDLETKAAIPPLPSARKAAPIADVAREAAATAALSEVAAELHAARLEGRLVQALPLASIDAAHLVRDRLVVDDDEMGALKTSLSARGQQSPIEVVSLGGGRYGLISGWRRLSALAALHEQTKEERFANVQAFIRQPESAGEAYVAMVEENEIRASLSYFERARIVARSVEEGVYRDEGEALGALFGSASRAKRSKIKSFLPVVAQLGAHLRFPAAIGERLGLDLAQRLKDKTALTRLKDRLRKAKPETAAAELALLAKAPPTETTKPAPQKEELAPGLWLRESTAGLTISGPALTKERVAELRKFLKG